jgi:hypothetical protein
VASFQKGSRTLLSSHPDRRSQIMTTEAENELLTRVGPGTLMGALMRQY